MATSKLAGTPARTEDLINVSQLIDAFYQNHPDVT